MDSRNARHINMLTFQCYERSRALKKSSVINRRWQSDQNSDGALTGHALHLELRTCTMLYFAFPCRRVGPSRRGFLSQGLRSIEREDLQLSLNSFNFRWIHFMHSILLRVATPCRHSNKQSCNITKAVPKGIFSQEYIRYYLIWYILV
jgi:hypothetical protein